MKRFRVQWASGNGHMRSLLTLISFVWSWSSNSPLVEYSEMFLHLFCSSAPIYSKRPVQYCTMYFICHQTWQVALKLPDVWCHVSNPCLNLLPDLLPLSFIVGPVLNSGILLLTEIMLELSFCSVNFLFLSIASNLPPEIPLFLLHLFLVRFIV